MPWRVALLVGVLLAVVCAAVGFTLDQSALEVRGTADAQATSTWPSPFSREIWYQRRDREAVITEGDEDLWYFAAGVILVVTLAALPLLRERDRRRSPSQSD
jgi:hypothetical protein